MQFQLLGYLLIIFFFFILYKTIYFLLYKITRPGFDHFYQIAIINQIHKNGHKFISKLDQWYTEENFTYPQLYHWIISLLPYFQKEKKSHKN